ncbi:MAG: tetratricopeptide repeat protein [Spirochaetales bacterium]
MIRSVLLALLLACSSLAQAQTDSTSLKLLEQGRDYYSRGEYLSALSLFQQVVADPATRAVPDSYLWLSKTYLALLDTGNATLNLDYYIQTFPRDVGQTEAAYVKGRIAYSQNDFEKALQAFGQFLEISPTGELVANALFWMGESAWSLGRYQDAAVFYNRIVQGYPSSFKLEASRYRLAVISLKQREDELMKLLQWSHTESMNSAEEFQRREKAYQQSLATYQKKLLELQATDTGARTTTLEETIKQKDAQIAALKVQMAGGAERVVTEAADQSKTIALLELKSRALDLKSFYLTWKDQNAK